MAVPTATLASRLSSAILHPEYGWKTTHFWGPVANWGLVGAAVYDASYKGPEVSYKSLLLVLSIIIIIYI